MAQSRTSLGRWTAGGMVASALWLSGCTEGIDLNGKVFDMMGISPAAQAVKNTEPKLAERAPIVLPPDTAKLPPPGSGQTPVAQVWPDDPDQRKRTAVQEREKLHLAYCRGDIQWKEKALDKDSVNTPRSPYGPCPTILGGVSIPGVNINKEEKE
ncbi:MAG: hypothetical protein E6G91_16965 [Alphaproteobacteria bacterium]|jgi:hypothetical protein|nr:MAG: hypothetical protein E6G91_16965 [Alphaproteobacteria bacterium]